MSCKIYSAESPRLPLISDIRLKEYGSLTGNGKRYSVLRPGGKAQDSEGKARQVWRQGGVTQYNVAGSRSPLTGLFQARSV